MEITLPITDRIAAGLALAGELQEYHGRSDVILLALPRGGVPVAFEIAASLQLRLDLVLVRKLGVPFQPELAMGAITSGGVRVLNEDVIAGCGLTDKDIEAEAQQEEAELERRDQLYRGTRPYPDLKDQTVILVDDGIATGATMLAAIDAVRQQQAASITVAVPVAPRETVIRMRERADQVICLATPDPFRAIGIWYRDFSQTSDDDVIELLQKAWKRETENGKRQQPINR